jgi:hypothetical protein
VWVSTAATAEFQSSAPDTTMATAPTIATPVRSTRNGGSRPRLSPT